MKTYGGRLAITGYVASEDHALVKRVAAARRVAVTDMVEVATLALARFLDPSRPADAPFEFPALAQLGLPPLQPSNPGTQETPSEGKRRMWTFQRKRESAKRKGKRSTKRSTND